MITITIKVAAAPSRSKGWARYKSAAATGERLTASQTGNEWVGGTTKTAEIEEAGKFTVTSQVALIEGRHRKQTTYTEEFRLVAEEGATAILDHKPGSQGQTLEIQNARLA